MRRIQIIDLDGCIADDRHRRCHIDPALQRDYRPEMDAARKAMWHEYHRRCFDDDPANLSAIREPEVIIITARPIRYREQTVMWLREVAYIEPLFIIMRNNHDRSSSVVVKRRAVHGLLDPNSYGIQRSELVLAIDDRSDIVEMYRSEFSLDAHIVRIGEKEHDHP